MFQQFLLKYYSLVFCIFKCILILLMGNIKCYHKTTFTVCLLKQRLISKQAKTKLF